MSHQHASGYIRCQCGDGLLNSAKSILSCEKVDPMAYNRMITSLTERHRDVAMVTKWICDVIIDLA